MAKIVPFKAVRPPRNKAHLVGSRSYLGYSDEELEEKLRGNPYTFLHIIMPEMHAEKRNSTTREERFEMVKEGYNYFKLSGILAKDESPCFYIYRQTKGGISHTGIIAGISVDDYNEGHIKIHEQTLTKREEIFKQYLDFTGFNAEPVLLAYPTLPALKEIQDEIVSHRAEYEFHTTDTVLHEMWMIDDPTLQSQIQALMAEVPDVYIADGHHRTASSALLAASKSDEQDPAHYFMAYLLPDTELTIYDFNRLVRDIGHMSDEDFLAGISEFFDVSEHEGMHKPHHHGEISMYMDNQWYVLEVKDKSENKSPVQRLDTYVLNRTIFEKVLGIEDIKTDSRLSFMDGLQGMIGLQEAVDKGYYKVAFGLYPISFEELKDVADAKEIMPPKSTWIEPKLRSGLTIYELFDD
jgi:uncharacterized protein (DUF1015 family)